MKRWRRVVLSLLLALWAGVAWYHTHKALPAGLAAASPLCPVQPEQVSFIADITAADAYGRGAVSQGIFDAMLQVVHAAQRFLVLDLRALAAEATAARHVTAELTDALLAQRRAHPALQVLFIVDPAVEHYGALPSPQLQLLRAAGVTVVAADLRRLRDPNFAYSALWRLALSWWSSPAGAFGLAAQRLNYKADARKVVLGDDGHGGLAAVVGSADPADNRSSWSNVAARLEGGALPALLASELAVARFSGWRGSPAAFATAPAGGTAPDCAATAAAAPATMQLLTEGAIRTALLEHLAATSRDDSIDVAIYQLGDRAVAQELLAAARRGVSVRLILDANEADENGGTSGLPNQVVASELVSRSGGALHVRWYRTHGERFHAALVMVYGAKHLWLMLGSAQLTRRSLGDYNLEANVGIETARSSALAQQTLQYFDTLWSNRAALGIEYTADFAAFANPSQADYWLYRLLEGAGLAGF